MKLCLNKPYGIGWQDKVSEKSAMWRHKNEELSISFYGVFYHLISLIFITSHGWIFKTLLYVNLKTTSPKKVYKFKRIHINTTTVKYWFLNFITAYFVGANHQHWGRLYRLRGQRGRSCCPRQERVRRLRPWGQLFRARRTWFFSHGCC